MQGGRGCPRGQHRRFFSLNRSTSHEGGGQCPARTADLFTLHACFNKMCEAHLNSSPITHISYLYLSSSDGAKEGLATLFGIWALRKWGGSETEINLAFFTFPPS